MHLYSYETGQHMLAVGVCLIPFGTTYTEAREAAQQLDMLGFDSLWLWDHYVSWNDPREPVLECWSMLSGLAEATRRIKLGPLVANNTNRHPGRLAKVAATLQEIAHGRLELGLGAGGLEDEQAAFGIRQGSPVERVEAVEEALQIIPALWSGEPVTFAGKHYHLNNAIVAPAPRPRPPIILAAIRPRMARLAGRYADGLNIQWNNRARFTQLFAALDKGLAERGRDRSGFDLSVHAGWNGFAPDPLSALNQWQQLGFTRAIMYVHAPFPLVQFENIARQIGL